MARRVAGTQLAVESLGVEPRLVLFGIHPTRAIHNWLEGEKHWYVVMFSDEIPRCVSERYYKRYVEVKLERSKG